MLPISEACERNKGPILEVLKQAFADRQSVLEIGSGTGQHALHFAQNLPHLVWQPSDFGNYLPGLRARLQTSPLPNLRGALELDVRSSKKPSSEYDAVFSANTLHIMSADAVEQFFELVGSVLGEGGKLVVYGPFNHKGEYSSPSNQQFDMHLKSQNPESAIRDFEWVNSLAEAERFKLIEDISMPANNRCVVWEKEIT
mgnify:FL=1|jgi:cyclopropane fatty-acyl-phospholipid synthase-like methyltransferase